MRISDWSSDVCSSDLVTIAVEGRQITQARAVGHVGNREILTVNAALGERPMDTEGQWAERPDVPSPEDSGPRMPRYPGTESIMDRIDTRLASALDHADLPGPGMPGGRSALWARIPDVLDMSAATRSEEHPSELQSLMRLT